jgi:hypothetical protein
MGKTAGHTPADAGALSLEQLEQRRDRTLRRVPALRVQGPGRAVRFINEVGLASLFATRGLHLPCLWVAVCGRRDPQFPHHTHHDPELGLAWNLKDQLPAAGKVFYAKLIRAKPTFVALDLLPGVYRLFGPQRDYVSWFRDGRLSPAAKAILDALHRKRPQETFELKLNTNLARPSQRRTFDNAMTEVQQQLFVAMREVRYEPFTYVWDLVEARFGDHVTQARRRQPARAAHTLAERYLRTVVYASRKHLASVIGNRVSVDAVIGGLLRAGVIDTDQRIDGLPGTWLTWRAATDG